MPASRCARFNRVSAPAVPSRWTRRDLMEVSMVVLLRIGRCCAAHCRTACFPSAAMSVFGRGLTGSATDRGWLRQQSLARNLFAAIDADAVDAIGHALLCLLD